VRSLFLLLLVLLADDQRALRFFDSIRFQKYEPEGDEGRRVMEILLNKEHWVSAYRTLEEKLGPFPDALILSVDFDFDGEPLARASGKGTEGRVTFNLKRLAEERKKLDALEEERKVLAIQGRSIHFNVPPMRFDRIIYHELTHVFQRNYEAPEWFNEGMAQWIGEDLNCVSTLAYTGAKVDFIDAVSHKKIEIYARGHLFWEWLASLGAARKVVEQTVFRRRPWKEAVEEATGNPWTVALIVEREWSSNEVERIRSKQR
jgi:hypothetical protein